MSTNTIMAVAAAALLMQASSAAIAQTGASEEPAAAPGERPMMQASPGDERSERMDMRGERMGMRGGRGEHSGDRRKKGGMRGMDMEGMGRMRGMGRMHGMRGMGMEMGGGALRTVMAGIWRNADADNDGRLTREELDAYHRELVSAADADGDGNLTLAEFETIWLTLTRSRMVDAFQELDEDGDAVVTEAERQAPFAGLFERLDRDDDGPLDADDGGRRSR